jgi:FxsC-like protein
MSVVFFSYNREDWDPYLKFFCDELETRIAGRRGLKPREAVFLDDRSVKLGENWTEAMREALRTCQAFVYLQSPRYFQSEYCGKEWRVFSDRVAAFKNTTPGANPRLMLPVVWQPPGDVFTNPQIVAWLPEKFNETQYSHGTFPNTYKERGLLEIIQRTGRAGGDVKAFLTAFIDRILVEVFGNEEEKGTQLPDGPEVPAVERVASAFLSVRAGTSPVMPVAPALAPSRLQNMLRARFYYAAAGRTEFEKVAWRNQRDCYGTSGGWDWLPYLPPPEEPIYLLVQVTATKLQIRCDHFDVDDHLAERMAEAQEQNDIVIVIADPWTLRLPRYQKALKECTQREFYNNAVLLVWNPKDAETAAALNQLRMEVRDIFANRYVLESTNYYLDSIDSREQLAVKLGQAIEGARGRIAKLAKVVRRAEPDPGSLPPSSLNATMISAV